jgi:hypothetical protein
LRRLSAALRCLARRFAAARRCVRAVSVDTPSGVFDAIQARSVSSATRA